MKKFNLLAFLAVAAFATSPLFAGDKACCASHANHVSKEACVATFAKLDLTAEQKSKMEVLAEDCAKGGCNKESMAKMEKSAKKILNKEQFAAWKAECSGKMGEKSQS
jgi:hypothetical protein